MCSHALQNRQLILNCLSLAYSCCFTSRLAILLQAYARKLASCFVELTKTESPSSAPVQITRAAAKGPALVCGAAANSPTKAALRSPALEKLRMWTRECSSLRAFLAVANIKKYLAFISHRLDGRPGLKTYDLDDKRNHDMLVCFDLQHAALTAAPSAAPTAAPTAALTAALHAALIAALTAALTAALNCCIDCGMTDGLEH